MINDEGFGGKWVTGQDTQTLKIIKKNQIEVAEMKTGRNQSPEILTQNTTVLCNKKKNMIL